MGNETNTAAATTRPTHDCRECEGMGGTLGTAWVNGREVDTGGECSECDGTGQVSPDCDSCGKPADHGREGNEWRCYHCQVEDEEHQAERAYRSRTAGRPHWSTNEDHEYPEVA